MCCRTSGVSSCARAHRPRRPGHEEQVIEWPGAGRGLPDPRHRREAPRLHAQQRQQRRQFHGADRRAVPLAAALPDLRPDIGPGVGHDDHPAGDAAPVRVAEGGGADPRPLQAHRAEAARRPVQRPVDLGGRVFQVPVERPVTGGCPALGGGERGQPGLGKAGTGTVRGGRVVVMPEQRHGMGPPPVRPDTSASVPAACGIGLRSGYVVLRGAGAGGGRFAAAPAPAPGSATTAAGPSAPGRPCLAAGFWVLHGRTSGCGPAPGRRKERCPHDPP